MRLWTVLCSLGVGIPSRLARWQPPRPIVITRGTKGNAAPLPRLHWLKFREPRGVLLLLLFQVLEHPLQIVIELRGVGLSGLTHLFHDFIFRFHGASSPI